MSDSLVDGSIAWLVVRLVCCLFGGLLYSLFVWFVDGSVDFLFDCLFVQLFDCFFLVV